MNELNSKKVDALKPKEKTYTMSDGAGMHLEVTPKGAKRWRFRYRFDNKARLVSLGVYPATSLADARKKREEARVDIANGKDPFPPKGKQSIKVEVSVNDWDAQIKQYVTLRLKQKHKDTTEEMRKRNQKKIETLEMVLFNSFTTFKQWTEYYKIQVADDVTEAHIERSVKGWKKDVFPVIGDMKMNDIQPKHIITIIKAMNNRGVKESAKKTFSSISRVYQVCMAHFMDEIDRNPTKDIALKDILGKREKVHYPIITDAKELGVLLKTIDEYQGHVSTRLALQLIAHTFVRPFNIRHAEWSEFNQSTRQWVIPASKMKSRKELIVPLSLPVMHIISEAKRNSGDSKLLFPSPKGADIPLSDAAMVGALRRMGYTKEEIVAHSFRGIFSTIAHEKDEFSHDVIETQLAHTVGSEVSQAYNRAKHLKERTQMMTWYSSLLEGYQNAK